MEEDIIMRNRS